MKKLNRNNADIENLRDKKVAVRLVGKDAEIDFRKWLKENGIHFNDKEVLLIRKGIGTKICYCVEGNSWEWCDEKWFIEKGYTVYEWEIAEEQKTCTIKDVVENEGKLYKIAGSSGLHKYKYENGKLLTNSIIADSWITSVMDLKELLGVKFVEYKPEPKKITFEEALKEMETKVYRSMFSNRFITIYDSQFFDVSNREITKLSLPEITGDWVVIEG